VWQSSTCNIPQYMSLHTVNWLSDHTHSGWLDNQWTRSACHCAHAVQHMHRMWFSPGSDSQSVPPPLNSDLEQKNCILLYFACWCTLRCSQQH